jgi:hypothetical protein
MHISFYFINLIAEQLDAGVFHWIVVSVLAALEISPWGEENKNVLFNKCQVQR